MLEKFQNAKEATTEFELIFLCELLDYLSKQDQTTDTVRITKMAQTLGNKLIGS